MLQTMLLRSMKRAIYDPRALWLAFAVLCALCLADSPLHRDLSLHRAVVPACWREREQDNTTAGVITTRWKGYLQLGQHCSMAERRADEATRDVSTG